MIVIIIGVNKMDKLIPLHEEHRSCLEDILVSIAVFLEKEYEIMYTEAWNFNYLEWTILNPGNYGTRISEGEDKTLYYLKVYQGIEMKYRKELNKFSDIIMEIKKNDNKNNPIIVYFNEFYCPVSKYYNLENRLQPYLIIGLNKNQEYIQICNPNTKKIIQNISCKDFEKAYRYHVIVDSNNSYINNPDFYNLVTLSARKMLNGCKNKFDQMRFLADDLSVVFDLQLEGTINMDNTVQSEILNTFTYITRRREQYSIFMNYISNKYDKGALEFADLMHTASKNWNIITNSMLRIFITKDWDSKKEFVANKIKSVADFEENVAIKILQYFK